MSKMRKRTASLLKLDEPRFLTLAGKPANKTGFRVIRSEEEPAGSQLLRIDFPLGITREDAERIIGVMGLEEDYVLLGEEAAGFYLQRSDTDEGSIESLNSIDIGHGYTAVVRMDSEERAEGGVTSGVKLLRFEFGEEFGTDDVKDWLVSRDVDFKPNGVESVDGSTVVVRHESVGGEEKVQIMPGVVGVICRSAEDDIPESISRQVVEQAYGNYGWGHLSFASAIADTQFTDKSWGAISVLRDVLEMVIFYSELSLDERKTLILNACDEYAKYMVGLLNALPTGVVEQVRNDRKLTRETENMSKQGKETSGSDGATSTEEREGEDVKRGDSSQDTGNYVTRDDVAEIVTKAVDSAFSAREEAKRTDEKAASDKEEADHSESLGTVAASLKTLGDTLEGISKEVKRMSDTQDTLKKEVDELSGTTVTRSEDDNESDNTDQVKRGDDSPFSGMFGDRPFNL